MLSVVLELETPVFVDELVTSSCEEELELGVSVVALELITGCS